MLPTDTRSAETAAQREARVAAEASIVVPAHNASAYIDRCLAALDGAPVREVLVVDDGSTDGTAEIAAARGVRVERLTRRVGAALARNHGVRASGGSVVLFVDADVVTDVETIRRATLMFDESREHVALFGSYDADPASHAPVSRFRNLLHHYTHQHGNREADTFWSGFGLVRRATYDAVGGLDPAWSGLEDIEFGYRLRDRGHRIRLEPSLQVKHLKRWTLRSMIRTDFWSRARLWTRLLLERGALPDDLNVRREQRWSVVLAGIAAASVAASFANVRWLLLTLAALAGLWWLNRGLYSLLRRVGGIPFAACSLPIHVVHLLCGGLGFACMWAEQRFLRTNARRAPRVSA